MTDISDATKRTPKGIRGSSDDEFIIHNGFPQTVTDSTQTFYNPPSNDPSKPVTVPNS